MVEQQAEVSLLLEQTTGDVTLAAAGHLHLQTGKALRQRFQAVQHRLVGHRLVLGQAQPRLLAARQPSARPCRRSHWRSTCASASSTRPSSVRRGWRPLLRSNRVTPRSASSSAMPLLTADCTRFSSRAAAENDWRSATLTNRRICSRFHCITYLQYR